jgi:putative flippase GtrA
MLGGDHACAQARRFLFVGLLNTAFGYGVFSVATLLGAHALPALLISSSAGVAFNFQTSRRLVFRRGDSVSAIRFVALYGALLLINWAAIRGLERLGAPALVAQAVLVLPLAGLSFLGQRMLIFRAASGLVPENPGGT